MNETEQAIIEYYQNLPAEKLILPEISLRKGGRGASRQYRLDLGTTFKIIEDRLDTPAKLKKLLISQPVYGVYTSLGRWLNSSDIRKIKKNRKSFDLTKVRRNPLIGSDFVVDIDVDFVENKDVFVDCYVFLLSLGYKNLKLKFTGRGGQILIPDFYKPKPDTTAEERLITCRQMFMALTNLLLEHNFPVDFEVMNDWPTRVVKMVPNTLSRRGTIVEDVDIKKIYEFVPKKIFTPVKIEPESRIISITEEYPDGTIKILK